MKNPIIILITLFVLGSCGYSSEADCIIAESQKCSTDSCVKEVTSQCKTSEDYDWNKPQPPEKEKKLSRKELLLEIAKEERLKKESEERSLSMKENSLDRANKREIALKKAEEDRLKAEKEANLVKQETFKKELAYKKVKFWKAMKCEVTKSDNNLDKVKYTFYFSFSKSDSSQFPEYLYYSDYFYVKDEETAASTYFVKQSKELTYVNQLEEGNFSISLQFSGVLTWLLNDINKANMSILGYEKAKNLFNDTYVQIQFDLDKLNIIIDKTDKASCKLISKNSFEEIF